jgi:ER membrane protein complex subunit 1
VASQVWELQLPEGEDREILSVVSKNPAERVHSQGRVLADRSVMYKYINPNLISVVSQVSDLSHKCESWFNCFEIFI